MVQADDEHTEEEAITAPADLHTAHVGDTADMVQRDGVFITEVDDSNSLFSLRAATAAHFFMFTHFDETQL